MHGKGYINTPTTIFYGEIANWLKHGSGEQFFKNNADIYKG